MIKVHLSQKKEKVKKKKNRRREEGRSSPHWYLKQPIPENRNGDIGMYGESRPKYNRTRQVSRPVIHREYPFSVDTVFVYSSWTRNRWYPTKDNEVNYLSCHLTDHGTRRRSHPVPLCRPERVLMGLLFVSVVRITHTDPPRGPLYVTPEVPPTPLTRPRCRISPSLH